MTKIYRRLIIGVTLAISAFLLASCGQTTQSPKREERAHGNDYFLSDVRLRKTSRW